MQEHHQRLTIVALTTFFTLLSSEPSRADCKWYCKFSKVENRFRTGSWIKSHNLSDQLKLGPLFWYLHPPLGIHPILQCYRVSEFSSNSLRSPVTIYNSDVTAKMVNYCHMQVKQYRT
jgi:hypothetical protein